MDHADGIYVINEHDIDFDISELLKKTPPAIPKKGVDEPQILIVTLIPRNVTIREARTVTIKAKLSARRMRRKT